MISTAKINRYSSEEIIRLNSCNPEDYERECVICRRSDRLKNVNGMCCCEICAGLLALSDSITRSGKDIGERGQSRSRGGGSDDIMAFIKDPFGCPYIPGSSIKGALRTAIQG